MQVNNLEIAYAKYYVYTNNTDMKKYLLILAKNRCKD